jgi:hypothetical protein
MGMHQSRSARVNTVTEGDFARLCADIEREARDEGSRAVPELEQLRAEFRQVGETIAMRRGLGSNLGSKVSATQEHSDALKPSKQGF